MSKEKQIEEMAKVIHESDMNYNTTFPISMGECLAKHGAVRTNAGIALYNAGYRKQSEWISVDERLPQVTGKYICCVKDKHENTWAVPADWSLEMKMWFGEFGEIKNMVTHWRPLPEPPVMKGGAE